MSLAFPDVKALTCKDAKNSHALQGENCRLYRVLLDGFIDM